jgi:hypothetical protein
MGHGVGGGSFFTDNDTTLEVALCKVVAIVNIP